MNILHLQPELNYACGISKIIYLLANNKEWNSHVIALNGDAIKKFIDEGIKIKILLKSRKNPNNTIYILTAISLYCKKYDIDIIHSHHRYFDLLASIISRITNIKTVTSIHSKVYGKRYLSYKAKKIIAVGEAIKEHVIKEFHIDHSRISILNNFVDPREIQCNRDPVIMRDEQKIPKENILIGYFGRSSIREKGIDLLFQAFKVLSDRNKNVSMIYVGNGEDDNFVRTNTQYEPKITRLDAKRVIYDYYNLCDIIVLPSRVEPFSVALLEYGFMGKAVVASSVDGTKEILEHEKDGLLFESENVPQLIYHIQRLIDDANLRYLLGGNFRKKILDKYTSEVIIPKYKTLYRELLGYG